jgi:acetyl esterase/lipase
MLGAEFPGDRARWHAQSAVEHLRGATTPTLILQGENDGRCPRGQGEEVFAHLIRYSDAPVEMVVYPGSTHGEAESGRPSNRLDYHGRICKWLARWAKQAQAPAGGEPGTDAGADRDRKAGNARGDCAGDACEDDLRRLA